MSTPVARASSVGPDGSTSVPFGLPMLSRARLRAMRCGRCGQENPVRARFCLACGAPLAGESRQERKVVSVLFVDLVGFTGRSQDGDPEDVRDTLQSFHRAAERAIGSFG